DGRVLAANGFPGSLDNDDLATTDPLRSALAGGQGHGMWVVGGQLCDVVAAPVESPAGGRRVGAVLVGLRIGNTALRHLHSLIQSHILLVAADGRVLASSLPTDLAREIARQQPRLDATPRRIEARGTAYLAIKRVLPLDWSGGRQGARIAQVLLRPTDDAEQLAYQIGRDLLLIGLVAFVLAFAFAW